MNIDGACDNGTSLNSKQCGVGCVGQCLHVQGSDSVLWGRGVGSSGVSARK